MNNKHSFRDEKRLPRRGQLHTDHVHGRTDSAGELSLWERRVPHDPVPWDRARRSLRGRR